MAGQGGLGTFSPPLDVAGNSVRGQHITGYLSAFAAALNPKMLAIDLVPIENRRPRAMFLRLLLGGLTVTLTIGLLDVLVFHADAPACVRRSRPRASAC